MMVGRHQHAATRQQGCPASLRQALGVRGMDDACPDFLSDVECETAAWPSLAMRLLCLSGTLETAPDGPDAQTRFSVSA
jgi:hypothetical protein